MSSFPRIASIGDIFEALLAGNIHDRYIVIEDITIDAIIANIGILKTQFSFKESPNNTLTTCNKITTASIPHNIPRGIPIIPI